MNKVAKKLLLVILFTLVIIPLNTKAITSDYKDNVYNITGTNIEENKINIYVFHGDGCPHCEDEIKWLKTIETDYKKQVNIVYFEVWYNKKNSNYMDSVMTSMNVKNSVVPFTVIGDKTFFGFSDSIKSNIENQINYYLENDDNTSNVNIPLLGDVEKKDISIPLVAVILGFIDGFNPCAMWILLFLINMLFGMKNKKKMWLIGMIFLFTSALVYFLSMLGISYILSMSTIKWLRNCIAIFAIIFGIFSIKDYFKKNDSGCNVIEETKRKKMFNKIKKITSEKSLILAVFGVIFLAVSVNMIELACSLGFPVIFTEILTINNVIGISRILYLLLYILFYILDDVIVFIIAMVTLEITGITTKYNKLSHLVCGIIMILMGFLLVFKPEWLMFNF